jgi:hypothetical protein
MKGMGGLVHRAAFFYFIETELSMAAKSSKCRSRGGTKGGVDSAQLIENAFAEFYTNGGIASE